MVGATISQYRIIEVLGQGGMGVVYRAQDEVLGRAAALKFCSTAGDPQRRRSLLAEARAASSLSHPNIAAIYEFGETESGEPFIAMELVEEGLAGRIAVEPLAPAETVRIVAAVARALDHAHAAGVIHRDIKPSNIRLTRDGTVKVVDFGLAKAFRSGAIPAEATLGETGEMEGVARGTPAFMSPEQARGQTLDGRSDLFSLGVVMYECLTRESPFLGPTYADTLAKVVGFDPPPPSTLNPRVQPRLDAIVAKLLAKRPADRYGSGAELLAALADLSTEAGPSLPPQRQARDSRRWWIAAGALAVVAALLAVWTLFRPASRPAPEAARYYEQGVTAMANATYYKAAKLLDRAVSIDAAFTMAHARLAEAWEELEDPRRAQRQLLTAIPAGRQPRLEHRDATLLSAIHAALMGQYDKAAALYREVANSSPGPERAGALIDLGRVLERAEKGNEALKAYEEAARLDPNSAAAQLRAGSLYGRSGNPKAAHAALAKAEQLYDLASDTEGLTECLYQRSRFEKDPPAALASLEKALALAEMAGNQQQAIKILLLQSHLYLRSGDTSKAVQAAERARATAERNGLESLTTRGLIDLGNALWTNGGRTYLERALDIATRTGSKRNEARASANLASLCISTGETAAGMQHAERALAFYRPAGYRRETAAVLVLTARVRQRSGDRAGAARDYSEARSLIEPLGPSVNLGWIQEGEASLAREAGSLPAAFDLYTRALETYRAAGASDGTVSTQVNLAELAARLGRSGEAEQRLAEAVRSAGSKPTDFQRSSIESARAHILLESGKAAAAAAAARSALARRENADAEGRCDLEIVLALAHARAGSTRQAVDAAQEAESAATRMGDATRVALARLAVAEAALAAGQPERARGALAQAIPALDAAPAKEAAWRARALQSLASAGAESARSAHEAARLYAALTGSWTEADAKGYASAPNVRKLLGAVRRHAG